MSTSTDRVSVLRDQLDLAWQLAEATLDGVTDEECRWLPAPTSWTVHRDDAGRWVPDWDDAWLESEPDDVAQPSLAWTMWQTIWWFSALLDEVDGPGTLRREDVVWPGAADGVAQLRELRRRWDTFLAGLDASDLDSGRLTGFPFHDDRPFVRVIAWATVELTKNVAEMGLLRRLARTARAGAP